MFVVAFCGLPGSGKSTLARMLERQTGWTRLDRDRLRREQFGTHGYTSTNKAWLNRRMLDDARTNLDAGKSVLVDGMTFATEQQRVSFQQLSEEKGARWLLLWLDCPLDLARRRVEADAAHPAKDRDRHLVERVAARFEPPNEGMRLDARDSLESSVAAVMNVLNARAGRSHET